jgi:hypothetical protein
MVIACRFKRRRREGCLHYFLKEARRGPLLSSQPGQCSKIQWCPEFETQAKRLVGNFSFEISHFLAKRNLLFFLQE